MHIDAHTAKFTALGLILAFLLSACSSQSVKTESSEDFGFDDNFDTVAEEEFSEPPPPLVEEEPAVRIALRDDIPSQYIVKKGDTLWDIASLFLQDPWLWPEIWYFNPQIDNPHLIYPGDILMLVYIDGKPVLRLANGTDANGQVITRVIEPSAPGGIKTIKMSPRIRTENLGQAIPTIPVSSIEPFLLQPRVITREELENAPYIVSSLDKHLISATGNTVYARNLVDTGDVRYNIFRPGRVFRDPRTREILGYETILVSEAKLTQAGDPASLVLTRSLRETLNGDRILPAEKGKLSYNFVPRPPETQVDGEIIALVDAISQTAQRQIIVMNLGTRHGIEIGTVLAIDQAGESARDPFAKKSRFRNITMPKTRAGLVMVFRVFDNVSYGLIMDSTRAIHVNDLISNPTPSADVLSQ